MVLAYRLHLMLNLTVIMTKQNKFTTRKFFFKYELV